MSAVRNGSLCKHLLLQRKVVTALLLLMLWTFGPTVYSLSICLPPSDNMSCTFSSGFQECLCPNKFVTATEFFIHHNRLLLTNMLIWESIQNFPSGAHRANPRMLMDTSSKHHGIKFVKDTVRVYFCVADTWSKKGWPCYNQKGKWNSVVRCNRRSCLLLLQNPGSVV